MQDIDGSKVDFLLGSIILVLVTCQGPEQSRSYAAFYYLFLRRICYLVLGCNATPQDDRCNKINRERSPGLVDWLPMFQAPFSALSRRDIMRRVTKATVVGNKIADRGK